MDTLSQDSRGRVSRGVRTCRVDGVPSVRHSVTVTSHRDQRRHGLFLECRDARFGSTIYRWRYGRVDDRTAGDATLGSERVAVCKSQRGSGRHRCSSIFVRLLNFPSMTNFNCRGIRLLIETSRVSGPYLFRKLSWSNEPAVHSIV